MTRFGDDSSDWKTLKSSDYGSDETEVSVGASCEIYSRSNNQWFAGHIADIYIDPKTKHRWFTVSYKNNTKLKKIQRFSKNLRFTERAPLHEPTAKRRATYPNLQSQITETSINVEIYKQNKTNCSHSTHTTNHSITTECDYLQRLFHALQHYLSLNIADNAVNRDIFITFCDDIYTQFINDWIHFISIHSHQTQEISAELISNHSFPKPTTTKQSPIITRHYHPSVAKSHDADSSTRFNVYRQMMDDAFFYIFYLHELGLRIVDDDLQEAEDMKHDAYDSMDYAFGRKKQTIINKRKKYALKTARFDQHNKFITAALDTKRVAFYYWPYYKDDERYVAPKYDTLKQEILTHLSGSKTQYDEILLKAQLYMNTDKVRAYGCEREDDLHFGIALSSPLSVSHLISLIIYCDCDAVSAVFRASFEDKESHRAYHFTAKYLKEAVEYYGSEGKVTWDAQRNQYVSAQHGPFYCGMDRVTCLDSFGVGLCTPVSTSKHIEIAIHCMAIAHVDGMIMQLNHNSNGEVRLFNCAWISRYAEEDEYLWFGQKDDNKMRIESIFIVERNQSFEVFMNAIYVYDCMLNETRSARMDITATDVYIMSQLISQNNDFDEYINRTFKLFCVNKRNIVIDIDYLNEHCCAMYYLVMHSTIQKECREDHEYDGYSASNVVNRSIFTLFFNVETITIHSTNALGTCCYAFSLSNFLGIISGGNGNCNWTQIQIKAVCHNNYYDYPQPAWISALWASSASQICAQYKAYGFRIVKQNRMTLNAEGLKEETLIITKY